MTKGYKAFDKDFKCRDFQYEVGKTYETNCEIKLCGNGFHYCKKIKDILDFYPITSRFAEIVALGDIKTDEKKSCTNKIKIVKELTREELLKLFKCKNTNLGENNLGDRNTGYSNTGNWNTGDSNTGDSNTGYWNTGDRNTGDRNTGYWNTGYWNTGDSNTGNWNTGDRNTGNWNTGDRNTGDSNTGDSNTGDSNTGNRNTGDSNTGNWNTGNWNTGNWNTGNSNTGNWNTGNWNTGDRNTGYFNSITPKNILVFNKKCSIETWENCEKPNFIFDINPNIWVCWDNMTEKEKAMESNKYAYVRDGYLKNITMKEAWAKAFKNATGEDISLLKNLPNYSYEVFSEISGLTDERLDLP